MQFGSGSRILAVVVVVLMVGTVAGLSIGSSMYIEIKNNRNTELPDDPVDRYELGQNAYEPPKIRALPGNVRASPDENQEYGRRVNGKRILVPNEPAIKKERMRLMEEQRYHKEWYDGYFGTQEPDYFYDNGDDAAVIPAEEYDRPVKRSDAELQTARLNAASSRKTAMTNEPGDRGIEFEGDQPTQK